MTLPKRNTSHPDILESAKLQPAFFLYNTPQKQYLRAKGWIPAQAYGDIPSRRYSAVPIRESIPPTTQAAPVMPIRLRGSVSPTYLFNIRILQVVLALVYLILVCYSGVHHGYWNNLSQPLGFGISASLITTLLALSSLLQHTFTAATAISSYLLYFSRVLFEFILMALWAAAFITMLLPKGKDFRLLFESPPYVEWDLGVVVAAFEILTFIWSMVLVMQQKYLIDGDDAVVLE